MMNMLSSAIDVGYKSQHPHGLGLHARALIAYLDSFFTTSGFKNIARAQHCLENFSKTLYESFNIFY
jgi:hypothetical protein